VVGSDDFDHWPAAAPMLRARDQQILVTREPMQFEEIIELADGPHTFLSVKFPLLDDDGVPVAVGSISTDITEVKDAVAATAARERVLSTVIGASPDVITILEDDGTIRTTSVAFERIFGYPTRALVDQKLVDVVHPEDRAETAVRLAGLHEGDGRVTLRFRGKTADGVWVTIESHAQVITRPDGSNDGIVMVSRDITDQIALEQALRKAKDQAERASNAKSEFLSRVSHELRTPLNAMLGFAQLLELEELEEPCTEYVDQIAKAGDHLLALINEVLDIARIESDNVNLRLEPVSALEAVHEVLDLTAPLAARAGVSLHGPDVDDVDVLLTADRQRLLQVLLNLVSNAIKYNHDGGRVDLTVTEETDRVVLTVHDTGPGLADEQIQRLFVPFDRLGLEHSGIEGTGVGLALSRGLTERMGGSLSVRSTPGVGSAFSIELPAVPGADDAPLPSTAPSSSTTTVSPPVDGAPGAEPASLPTLTGGRQ
jgi:PAS domain S-box-containing protein